MPVQENDATFLVDKLVGCRTTVIVSAAAECAIRSALCIGPAVPILQRQFHTLHARAASEGEHNGIVGLNGTDLLWTGVEFVTVHVSVQCRARHRS